MFAANCVVARRSTPTRAPSSTCSRRARDRRRADPARPRARATARGSTPTLREKAERLRRDRAAQAEQAAAEERARIAGELHDIVAHAMSAMVVQAGGARRLAEQGPRAGARRRSPPSRRRAARRSPRSAGCSACCAARTRRSRSRRSRACATSTRSCAASRAAGLPVTLEVDGEERAAAAGRRPDRLPARAGGARRRARRRAPPAAPTSSSATGPTGSTSRCSTTARRRGRARAAGVRERVSLYGGQLHAGPPAQRRPRRARAAAGREARREPRCGAACA